MKNDQFLVIKGKAGMGNRILSVLDGILYSQITGRQLIVDWSDYTYSNDNSNIFPLFFDLPSSLSLEEIKSHGMSIHPVIWQNHLNDSLNKLIDMYEKIPSKHRDSLYKYTFDLRRIDYNETILVKCSVDAQISHLRRYFKENLSNYTRLNNESVLKRIFRDNLKLNEKIQQRVKSFKQKHFTQPTIGVHIRYTDRKTILNKYPKIIERIIKSHDSLNNPLIFLATDSKSVEDYFVKKYGITNVIYTQKWHPNTCQYIHQNPECPDRFENGVEALVDMYSLGNCDYLIYDSISTFGLIAKLISDIPEANIIDISRYSLKKQFRGIIKYLQHWSYVIQDKSNK